MSDWLKTISSSNTANIGNRRCHCRELYQNRFMNVSPKGASARATIITNCR